MKFLVTGGAGFIGGNYLHIMTKKYPEDEFVCLDSLTYAGNMETLSPIMDKKNFKFVKGDIRDRDFVYSLFEKEHFDYVINFAAESHVDRSIENPQIFLETNIIGVSVLMDACRKFGIKRYHQVSTDEVYGDLPLDRPDLLFHEDTPLHTSSPYSSSKASADLLVLAYHRTYGLPVTISRCSNNYGPYQFPEKLIPLMIQKARKNEKLPVYGDGKNVRDWLHVSDHCKAIDLIVRNGRDGEIYNVGGHNERSNLQVVETILKALGKDDSLIEHVKDRLGHDRRYAICPDKIEKELGWKPEYNFDTGIAETIKWNVENQEWLNHVESGEYRRWMERYENL
ncbi:MAG TPA: dTDP-glucose 4,6-dehydratase [Candidatus Enterosoma merdigallinarum]|nr:dTDP-glucose 4,6-dehydratase [Candidatus Enterosoma merdigallinarum]